MYISFKSLILNSNCSIRDKINFCTQNTFVNPFVFVSFSPFRRHISITILAEMKRKNKDEITIKKLQVHTDI